MKTIWHIIQLRNEWRRRKDFWFFFFLFPRQNDNYNEICWKYEA